MDVCMNCGLCSEYCPFDAIKMDQNFELSNYERHQTHIYSLQDLLVSSEYYARTHPEAWASADEVAERNKVAKKKDQRLQKALAATAAKPAAAAKAAPHPRRQSRSNTRRCKAAAVRSPTDREERSMPPSERFGDALAASLPELMKCGDRRCAGGRPAVRLRALRLHDWPLKGRAANSSTRDPTGHAEVNAFG